MHEQNIAFPAPTMRTKEDSSMEWISLAIGNSLLHWAMHNQEGNVLLSWVSAHLSIVTKYPEAPESDRFLPLACIIPKAINRLKEAGWELDPTETCMCVPEGRFWMSSVVPDEAARWKQRCPNVQSIENNVEDQVISIANGIDYPTLGIDRALALRGAGLLYGWPVLCIDCGSAITYTAGNDEKQMSGGAILPGFGMQLQALSDHTAQVPLVCVFSMKSDLPSRWALDTSSAVRSGVSRTIIAGAKDFIIDWWHQYPMSHVVITGGDGGYLFKHVVESFQSSSTEQGQYRLIHLEADLGNVGIASYREGINPPDSVSSRHQTKGMKIVST